MSDPMVQAMRVLGEETNWTVTVVAGKDGRLLIVPDGTDAAVGEIIVPTGERVMFDAPQPLEGML